MTTKEMREFFRVGLEKAVPGAGSAADLMSFAGCWSDMPDEQFTSLATEWQERRHGAFARRRDNEADKPAGLSTISIC